MDCGRAKMPAGIFASMPARKRSVKGWEVRTWVLKAHHKIIRVADDNHIASRFSCARPLPIDRRRNVDKRWRAAVKRLLPAVYLSSSPTTDRLPKLPPATISGSGEVSGDQPRDAR